MQEKILGHADFLKNRIKKDNFEKFFWLRSNKSALLIQHDVICGTDSASRNAFPMVKLSKSISHAGMKTKSPKQSYSLIQSLW